MSAPWSPGATVARGAVALLSTQPITWAGTLLATLLVPRLLGDFDLGQYAVAATVGNLTLTIALFGIPSSLTRRVARSPRTAHEDASAALVVAVGLATCLAFVLILMLSALGFSLKEPYVLPLALVGTVPSAALTVLSAMLVGQERFARSAWLNAGPATAAPVLGVGSLLAGGGVLGYVGAGLAVYVLAAAIAWRVSDFRFVRSGLQISSLRAILVGGSPFLSWDVASRIRSDCDRILLVILSSASAVGWYAAAWRIIAIPMFVPTLLTTPLLPALSRSAGDRSVFGRTLRRTLTGALLMILPMSGMLIALAPALPSLFHWGTAFNASVPVIVLLAAQQPILVANMVLGTGLIALNRERRWLVVGVLGAILNPALNLLAIPIAANATQNAAIGAAIVVCVTETFMLIGAVLLVPPGILTRSLLRTIGAEVAAAIGLVLVCVSLHDVSVPVAIVSGALTYPVLLVVFGVVRAGDVRTWTAFARRTLAYRKAGDLEA